MSWVNKARRNFLPSLTIRESMIGIVEFLGEPESQSFGKKKNLKGEEVDDNRIRASVKYIGGSAMYKEENSFYPAKVGEEYALWMGATLSGAILDILGWQTGNPVPLMAGTKWKIWRGEYGKGGNRIYEAELISGDFTPVSTPEPEKAKPSEAPYTATDETQNELADAIKKLGEIDRATWAVFAQSKGVPAEKVDEVTKLMVDKGLIFANAIKVSSKPIE